MVASIVPHLPNLRRRYQVDIFDFSWIGGSISGVAPSLILAAGLYLSIPKAVPATAAPQAPEPISQIAKDQAKDLAPEPEIPREPELEAETPSAPDPGPESEPTLKYQNSTFTGSGEGYYGMVTISVTISDDVTTSISIDSYVDDDGYYFGIAAIY